MVAETRRRLAAVLGAREATWRVTRSYMHDLSEFVSDEFDLVVALGVLQDVWVGFGSSDRRMTLPTLERLDGPFLRHSLEPVLPTERVRVETAGGQRVTLNALYKKT